MRAAGLLGASRATGYLHILSATPVAVRRASESEGASLMPADWQHEVEVRKAARIAREKARQAKAREMAGKPGL